ncbi:cobalamin biosynthesis protein CobG [Raineyella fluvialis]|uniref:cobalamin biosynthesis protein CobG n=1 Tax=Raineyella fluvialis TaxID=2662261 RepID=UPI00188EC623|nr:cobalamin biosynthesis protein CobG [Raineyella fluvialis]
MPQSDASTDGSPGLTRPFRARDGGLVRLRIPGGHITSQVLRQLSEISAEYSDGLLQLTIRGNIQLRSMTLDPYGAIPASAINAFIATGIIPRSHERVRTILCSPLPSSSRPDLRPMVDELDAAIQAEPQLEDLPGSFVWAFDDGRGDIAAERWDLLYQAVTPSAGIIATSTGEAWDVLARQAVETMIWLAQEFSRLRLREDPPPLHPYQLGFRSRSKFGAKLSVQLGAGSSRAITRGHRPHVGPVGEDLLAGVPLGLLTPEMVDVLPRGEITITPWRQLLVEGGAYDMAAFRGVGYAIDPAEPWAHVSACTGAIGCVRTEVDTLAMAERLVDAATNGEVILTEDVHISGCEHRCGAPRGPYVDVVAPQHVVTVIDTIEERRLMGQDEGDVESSR